MSDLRVIEGGHIPRNTGGANNLPVVHRVGRLDTLPRIRREMQRKYQQAAAGQIMPADLTRYVFALKAMAEVIQMVELEARLTALEQRHAL